MKWGAWGDSGWGDGWMHDRLGDFTATTSPMGTCCCDVAAVVQPCGPCRLADHEDCIGAKGRFA